MTMVRIARPDDPELAALWDEAKVACAERESRQLSRALELATGARTDADCCRGDLRLCRCEPAVRAEELEDDEWMAATGGEE